MSESWQSFEYELRSINNYFGFAEYDDRFGRDWKPAANESITICLLYFVANNCKEYLAGVHNEFI